jgi:hypothetical protein
LCKTAASNIEQTLLVKLFLVIATCVFSLVFNFWRVGLMKNLLVSRLALGCLAVAVFATVATPVMANRLSNPGFEEEDTDGLETIPDSMAGIPAFGPGDAENWNQPTGDIPAAVRDSAMPRTGDWAMALATTPGFVLAYGEVAVTPGTNYEFSVWAKVDDLFDGVPGVISNGNPNSQARVRIEWWPSLVGDNSGAEISREQLNITTLATNTYQRFSVSGIAPPTANKLRAVVALSANTDKFYFDDANVRVPEPGTISVALLGFAGFLSSRSRRLW